VEVHVFDGSGTPHLVARFAGSLRAGYSMTGGEPNEQEAIFVRLESGDEEAAINLDRELYAGGVRHPDGALTTRFGSVELLISPTAPGSV
jgi:hypothetical protein